MSAHLFIPAQIIPDNDATGYIFAGFLLFAILFEIISEIARQINYERNHRKTIARRERVAKLLEEREEYEKQMDEIFQIKMNQACSQDSQLNTQI